MSDSNLINILNTKLAQMVSFKRIRLKQTTNAKPKIINYYGLAFVPSGMGKDHTVDVIDDYLFTNFKSYFLQMEENLLSNQKKEIEKEARLKFPTSEKRQSDYIEKAIKMVRSLPFEIKDGTPEGLNAGCLSYQKAGFGSVFVKIPELARYVKNPTQQQEHFLNVLMELYEGSASAKITKMETEMQSVSEIPCNCLFYSDSTELLSGSAQQFLSGIFDTALARRANITYQPLQAISIINDPFEEEEMMDNAYRYGKEILKDKIFNIFTGLSQNAEFELTKEARLILHEYKQYNTDRYNGMLKTADDKLLKEINGRTWKTLKLAGLISAIEHPKTLLIEAQDVLYSIYQSELFAIDMQRFFKAKPKSDDDKLFAFLLENKNNWITKNEIRNQNFVSKNNFKRWFDEVLEYINQMAEDRGYMLKEESYYNNSGTRYKLVENNLSKELSSNIIDFNKIIA
jgi:hypothetical protein